MTPENADAHERAIRDQFSRQAVGFAAAPELHADDPHLSPEVVRRFAHALRRCRLLVGPLGTPAALAWPPMRQGWWPVPPKALRVEAAPAASAGATQAGK
jgi:hypothetical protein